MHGCVKIVQQRFNTKLKINYLFENSLSLVNCIFDKWSILYATATNLIFSLLKLYNNFLALTAVVELVC